MAVTWKQIAFVADVVSLQASTPGTAQAGHVNVGGTIIAGGFTANGLINAKNYTVATLPAATRGDIAYVTDALAPAFLTLLVGGGTVVTPAFYNGTNWIGF